ncbi:MAG: glycerophosphodiester phosphodiesterase [Fidelibacterota bacterium]
MILSITVAGIICLLIVQYFTWHPDKGEDYYIRNPLWFAHRGSLLTSPENTIASYLDAWKKGLPAIELDVVSTKDGVVVCSHNFDLERKTKGRGYIHQMNYRDLVENLKNDRSKTPTLEEGLDSIKKPVRVNIEIKTSTIFDFKTARRVANIIEKKQLTNRVMISSFNPFSLWIIKWLHPSILTGFIVEQKFMIPFVHCSRADFLHPDSRLVTERLMDFARKRKMKINVWTVNTKPGIDWLIKQGVDGIITDRLEFYIDGKQVESSG